MTVSRWSPLVRMMAANSRCSSLRRESLSNPAMPMMAFSGVRISWLIVARKRLLACVASSRSWLLRSSWSTSVARVSASSRAARACDDSVSNSSRMRRFSSSNCLRRNCARTRALSTSNSPDFWM